VNNNTIHIEVGDKQFTGWKSIAVDFDMESVSSSFSFTARDRDNILSDLQSGEACKLYVNGDILILDGYIVERSTHLGPSTDEITISGNDRTIDLVECSAVHKSRVWVNKKLSVIAKDLAEPFSVEIDSNDLLEDTVIEKLAIQSGETAFDALERLCRSQAVLPISTFDGKIKLTYAADFTHRADSYLISPGNIKEITETTTWADRYSEYVGLSQATKSGKQWTKELVQGKATAIDRGVDRYRPLIIIAENKLKREELIKRVNWEAQVRAGRSSEYTVVTSGWYQKDQNGKELSLWEKNKRTRLQVESKNIDKEVLITTVSFTLDNSNGEQTVLGLRHPDTYKVDPTEEVKLT